MDPLQQLITSYEPEGEDERQVLERMRTLASRGDPWDRNEPLHLTASALVIDRLSGRVLLRWHERVGRWLHVGGHGDPGELDPWEIALREAREETGLDDLEPLLASLEARPVQLTIVPVPASSREPAHEHADIRYLLATLHPEDAVAETPAAQLRWLAIPDAVAESSEESFRRLLERAGKYLDEGD